MVLPLRALSPHSEELLSEGRTGLQKPPTSKHLSALPASLPRIRLLLEVFLNPLIFITTIRILSSPPAARGWGVSMMESREDVVVRLAEAGEPQGKQGHRGCLSPGAAAAPYSRERAELLLVEEEEEEEAEEGSARRKRRGEQPRKNGSSSDTESDFYEEIDVSCTPESMDYPTAKGRLLLRDVNPWLRPHVLCSASSRVIHRTTHQHMKQLI